MSSSSSEVMQQVERVMEKERFPCWVTSLLGKRFFEKCAKHDYMLKCEVNRYCISCNASICRFCIINGPHLGHNVLTIYRHVYQNVVPLIEMETHMNCQRIQPYKCNKKWVVSLTPLPHNGSGLLIEGHIGACLCCKRKLTDADRFSYCSIACKVQSVLGMKNGFMFASASASASAARKDEIDEAETPRKRSRKGVPIRAPLS